MDRALYDDDFYAWTQEQAELLRQGTAGGNRLDFDLIAEEIEDLGKSELHTVQSLCEHIIEHFLKIEYSGLSESVRHWRREIAEWRVQVRRKSTRSILAKVSSSIGIKYAPTCSRSSPNFQYIDGLGSFARRSMADSRTWKCHRETT